MRFGGEVEIPKDGERWWLRHQRLIMGRRGSAALPINGIAAERGYFHAEKDQAHADE
jgi:hypothetical protein